MKKILTTDELTDYLSVTRQSVYNWRKEGMPYKKLGSLVRFDLDEVLSWLEEKGKEMEDKK